MRVGRRQSPLRHCFPGRRTFLQTLQVGRCPGGGHQLDADHQAVVDRGHRKDLEHHAGRCPAYGLCGQVVPSIAGKVIGTDLPAPAIVTGRKAHGPQ